MSLLAPIYSSVSTLLSRLTADRASNLDDLGNLSNLNDTITSRAPSSTALSTETWTSAKANTLDVAISTRANGSTWNTTLATNLSNAANSVSANVDAKISTRSTLTDAQVWSYGTRTLTSIPSVIKSVQRASSIAAGTAALNPSVDTNKSIIISVSKGSNGTVAVSGTLASGTISGTITGTLNPDSSHGTYNTGSNGPFLKGTAPFGDEVIPTYSGTRTLSGTAGARTLSGGTTDLTTKQYSAVLTSNTVVTFDGPVEYQVIEYY